MPRVLTAFGAGCVLLLFATLRCDAAGAETLRIVYPQGESAQDRRAGYPVAVLRLALQRAGVDFELVASPWSMPQARSLRLLERREGLDIVWSQTDDAREKRLRRVRWPIDRGLLGWRLLLIRRGDGQRFAAVRGTEGLVGLVAGQGHDWPDVAVLRDAGLPVVTGTDYEGLFGMLARRRFDYFPRGVSEAFGELDARAGMPLEVEATLLMQYPAALYFFVHRDAEALAGLLEAGLSAAHAQGSLQSLFDNAFGPDILRARLSERQVLSLPNPLVARLRDEAPAGWWFSTAESR